MQIHDYNMPHDVRALSPRNSYADLVGIQQDGYDINGCPPNCPARKSADEELESKSLDDMTDPNEIAAKLREDWEKNYPAKGEYDKHFPLPAGKVGQPVEDERVYVYVSGPMRGQEDDNFATFNAVTEMLDSFGYGVFNPASKGHLTEDYTWHEAMKTDIEWVMEADFICLLPGWEQSEGARLEINVARTLGKKFMEAVLVTGEGEEWWTYKIIDTPQQATVEGIDAEARRLVYGARAQTYGHPRGDFDCIGGIWAAMLEAKIKFWAYQNGVKIPDIPFKELVNAELVSTMMTGLKLARQVKSPEHRDTGVDAIGYQLCLQRVQEAPEEIAAWEAKDGN